jgi:hypothetical protein
MVAIRRSPLIDIISALHAWFKKKKREISKEINKSIKENAFLPKWVGSFLARVVLLCLDALSRDGDVMLLNFLSVTLAFFRELYSCQ